MYKFFIVIGLILSFPVTGFASLKDDPRFEVTTYNYLSHINQFPGFVEFDDFYKYNEGDKPIVFDIYGDYESVTIGCDGDFFKNEETSTFKNDFIPEFDKNLEESGRVQYTFYPNGYRFSMNAEVIDFDLPRVVRCDIEEYIFNENSSGLNNDLSFTLGNSGVFYVGDSKPLEAEVDVMDDIVSVDINILGSSNLEISDVEFSCIYYGGDSPVDKILLDDKEYDLDIVSKDILYGRWLAFHGPFPRDFNGEEFYELFTEQRNYLYRASNLELNDLNNIKLILNDLEGYTDCYIDKVFIEKGEVKYEYAYEIGRFVLPGSYGDSGLKDVLRYSPNYEGYKYLVEKEIIDGYENGNFEPDRNINRAEAAKILAEAFFEVDKYTESCFSDVDEYGWYMDHVCTLKSEGVVQGVGDSGLYHPGLDIHLDEAYKMVFESVLDLELEGDLDREWFEKYIDLAEKYAVNIHTGYDAKLENGELFYKTNYEIIDDPITRGEFAEIVYKVLLFDDYIETFRESLESLDDISDVVSLEVDKYQQVSFDVRFECSLEAFDKVKKLAIEKDNLQKVYNLDYVDLFILFPENKALALSIDNIYKSKSGFSGERGSTSYSVDYDYEYNLFGYAANSGCIDLVDYYLDRLPYEARNDLGVFYGKNILQVATDNKDLDLIKYLVEEKQVEFGLYGLSGIQEMHFAVDDNTLLKGNEIEIIQYFIDNGVDINDSAYGYMGSYYETNYTLAATEEIRQFLRDNGYELVDRDYMDEWTDSL